MVPFSNPVEFETKLPAFEVVRRLESVVCSPFALPFFTSRTKYPVMGRIRKDGGWFAYRTLYNNGFQRRLYLNFRPSPGGTSLVGECRPNTATLFFSLAWCSFVILFLVGALSHALTLSDSNAWELVSAPCGMLLFMIALFSVGVWWSSFSENKVLKFVSDQLDDSSSGVSDQSPAGETIFIRPRHKTPEL